MINITKQGNNVIVTSDNPNSFHIGNGELSVPLNTIYYVLDDESDFIQFNSTEEGNILFNGTIGQIQVNGNIVNRENILMELDNVFNSAATGGEGGTAGVLSINGYDGYINLKSINGQSLIGSGDIEIEGGASAGVNKIIMGDEDYGWNAYQGDIKLTNGWVDLDDDGKSETYDIRVGNNESSSLWFGFNSTDNSIKIEDNGSRLSFTVNPDILGGGGSTAGVSAINIGEEVQDWTQKTGVVSLYTLFYDGSYDVSIGGTSFYGLKPIDDTIKLEYAGGTVNGNFRCGIKVNEDNFKTINGESIFGTGDITIQGGGSEPEQYVKSVTTDNVGSIFINNNDGTSDRIVFPLINGQQILGNGGNIEISGGSSEEIPTVQTGDTGTSSNYIYSDATPKNGVVAFISNQRSGDGKGTYSGITYRYWNDVASNRFVTLDWTGTQAQYDALGEYSDYITYNIIEDEE